MSPIAMPTGTRKSIKTKRVTNPRSATASVLILLHRLQRMFAFDDLRLDDEQPSAHRNENDGGNVADPCDGKERPCGQLEIESEHIIRIGLLYLVEQCVCLRGHDEQKHERREYIDEPLVPPAGSRPAKLDR